jgi:hypothetical protein
MILLILESFLLLSYLRSSYSQLKTKPPSNQPTPSPTSSPTSTVTVDYSCLHANLWKVNKNNDFNVYFNDTVDIINSSYSFYDESWEIYFNSLVNYTTKLSDSDITSLNSRPNAKNGDFKNGAVSIR